jgi:hypothetical protein
MTDSTSIKAFVLPILLASVVGRGTPALADDVTPDSPGYGQSKSDLHKEVQPEPPSTHIVGVKPVTGGPGPSTSSSSDPSNASSMGLGLSFDLYKTKRPRRPQSRSPKAAMTRRMRIKSKLKVHVIRAVLVLLALAGAARLVHAGYIYSMDFAVYWRAGQSWAGRGVSPYLYSVADQGFVFKYPPWILPVFFPLGFIPENASRLLWSAVELLCLGYSIRKLIRLGIDVRVALVVTAMFWWVWLAHFYAGQFTLLLLAAALWVAPPPVLGRAEDPSPGKLAILAAAFSAKVFSMITLLGLARAYSRWRVVAAGLALFVGLHLAVFAVFWAHGTHIGLFELYHQWLQAADSGGQELGDRFIRGQMNHGFTAGLLRAFHVDVRETSVDHRVALGLGVFFSALWWRLSRPLDALECWVGWLALGVIIHPLAWHSSFVLTFPLCAVSLDRAIRSKDRRWIFLSLLGICLIDILIPNVIGPDAVKPLELLSEKSWGVCCAAAALLCTRASARADA